MSTQLSILSLLLVALPLSTLAGASAPGSPEEIGEHLLRDRGCVGCHAIAETEWEKNGPSLVHLHEKVNAPWLVAWLKDPRDYLPRTRMPHFGMDEEASLAVAAYLLESSTPSATVAVAPAGANPENGARLVSEIGCLGCHSLQPKTEDEGPDHGPNLTEIGSKTHPDWLYKWLREPTSHDPYSRMPNLRLSEEEALDIAAYLGGLGADKDYPAVGFPEGEELEDLVSSGKDLVEEKGCFGCHAVYGFEEAERIGSEIADWAVEDFEAMHQSGEEEDPLVPQYSLSAEQVAALAAAANEAEDPEGEAAAVELGRLLVRRYNCTGCHQVECLGERDFWGGDIRETIEDAGYFPPILYGEGAKVQTEWLTGFLSEVTAVRPWMRARMPSFNWREGEVEALVAYFKALSETPLSEVPPAQVSFTQLSIETGMMLFAGFQCINCHAINQEMIDATYDKASLAPDLSMVPARLRFDWLHHWMLDPQEIAPGTRMPDNFPDMGENKNASLAYMLIQAPQNAELKTWFTEHYAEEDLKKNLEDTDWVIDRMRDHLWNFDAQEYLSRFPWTAPPAPVETEEEEEEDSYEDEDY